MGGYPLGPNCELKAADGQSHQSANWMVKGSNPGFGNRLIIMKFRLLFDHLIDDHLILVVFLSYLLY